jgi:hypothetical protein
MNNEPVKIRVSGVNFIYNEDNTAIKEVSVSFQSSDPQQRIYANGQVIITPDEYMTTPGVTALGELAKERFLDRFVEIKETE